MPVITIFYNPIGFGHFESQTGFLVCDKSQTRIVFNMTFVIEIAQRVR